MEVKPGYKQTEAGVIPEEWDCEKLEEYFSLISYGFTNPMPTVNHGIFMVTAADINEGRLQLETARKTTETAYRTLLSSKSKPRKNDILLTKDGSLGRLALVGDEKICINQSVAVIRPNQKVEPTFLKLLLESPRYQRKMLEDAGGSTIKHIYITIVNLMRVGLPPCREEQRAVAEALSDVDELLGALDRLIAKKRDLKQAAMQQLLTGETRLPGFHGEWEVKPIGEIATVSKGSQLHSTENNPDGHFPHFNGGISPSSYTDKSNTPANTIAISEGGNSCGYVQMVFAAFWCGGHCYAVVPSNNDNGFLYHALKGRQNAIKALRVGSGLPNVQKTALAAFKLNIPSERAEQTAIAEVLTDIDAQLAALEERLEKTRDLKQAMMQDLFTGKTRLL